ncbi:unnamed protein product [Dicrocoelium dendriticum]|nr:unnamed protein product [Dicrocoelium dendriticum]
MLDLTATLFLTSFTILYAVYAVTWLCWYIWKDKSSLAIADTEEVLFSGGQNYIRNVLFLGIAMSQLFSPNLLNEHSVNTTVAIIVLLTSRVLAFGICVAFFNHLASLRCRTMEEYIRKRFDSVFLTALHLVTRILGLHYSWIMYIQMHQTFGLFNAVSSLEFVYVMGIFATTSALGGLNVVLVGCFILWFLEITGQSVLFYSAQAHMFKNQSLIHFQLDPCYSEAGPNLFLVVVSQLLTIQPTYTLFQAATSRKQANIAMGIGVALFLFNNVLSICSANGLRNYAQSQGLHFRDGLHGQYNLHFEQVSLFRARSQKQQEATTVPSAITISFSHFLILFGSCACGSIAMFLLQVQSLAMHTYLNVLPKWLRFGLISDGRELHITFSTTYLLCAYLGIMYLTYPYTIPPQQEEALNQYYLYQPLTSQLLLMPVLTTVIFSPLCSDVWSLPVVVVTCAVVVIGMIFSAQTTPQEVSCSVRWMPTIFFLVSLGCVMFMSFVLRAPKFIPTNLLFKYHFRLRRKKREQRIVSIINESGVARFGRASLRFSNT